MIIHCTNVIRADNLFHYQTNTTQNTDTPVPAIPANCYPWGSAYGTSTAGAAAVAASTANAHFHNRPFQLGASRSSIVIDECTRGSGAVCRNSFTLHWRQISRTAGEQRYAKQSSAVVQHLHPQNSCFRSVDGKGCRVMLGRCWQWRCLLICSHVHRTTIGCTRKGAFFAHRETYPANQGHRRVLCGRVSLNLPRGGFFFPVQPYSKPSRVVSVWHTSLR